jgi:hypothetical protein
MRPSLGELPSGCYFYGNVLASAKTSRRQWGDGFLPVPGSLEKSRWQRAARDQHLFRKEPGG